MIDTYKNTSGTWRVTDDPAELSEKVRTAVGERAAINLVSGAVRFVAALDQPLGRGTAFVVVLTDRVVARRASGKMQSAHHQDVVGLDRALNGDVVLRTPGGKVALFGMMGLPAKPVLETTYQHVDLAWRHAHTGHAAVGASMPPSAAGVVPAAPIPSAGVEQVAPRPGVPVAPAQRPFPVPVEPAAHGGAIPSSGAEPSKRRLVLLGFGGVMVGAVAFNTSPVVGWLLFTIVALVGLAALTVVVRGDGAPKELADAVAGIRPYRWEAFAVGVGLVLAVLTSAAGPPPDPSGPSTSRPARPARTEAVPSAPALAPAKREPREERPVQIPTQRTKGGYLAALTREKHEKAIEILASGDEAGFNSYLALNPDIFELKGGIEVYVVETALLSGLVKLRPKGKTVEFWTNIEAVQ